MLEQFKIMLEITDNTQDLKLDLLLKKTTKQVQRHIKNPKISVEELEDIILDLAEYKFNIVSGIKTENYGNMSTSYDNEIPAFISVQLDTYKPKKLRVL